MKKILLLLLLIVTCFQGFSQTPGISYQAVILNPNTKELPGANTQTSILANSKVAIRFTIIDELDEQEYQEYHVTNTDAYGMINLLIGHGTRNGSSYFEDILWNGLSKKLKVDIDFSGTGNNYTVLSEQALTFMPQPALGQDSQAILDNTNDIIAERNRAIGVESLILTNLDTEVELLSEVDATLQSDIDLLKSNMGTNGTTISNTITALQANIDANETATLAALDVKVDKISGKGLSTEDYTTAEKTKLGAITGTNTGDQDISGIAINSTNIGDLTSLTTTANENLVAAINEIDLEKANLQSPSFTGTPLAPTAPAGTNTTQIATTAFVNNAITNATPVIEVVHELIAIASQTSFTLPQTPSVNSKVKMYVNGIRISNQAYSVGGNTLTYVPVNNGGYALVAGDRIQMDFYY